MSEALNDLRSKLKSALFFCQELEDNERNTENALIKHLTSRSMIHNINCNIRNASKIISDIEDENYEPSIYTSERF